MTATENQPYSLPEDSPVRAALKKIVENLEFIKTENLPSALYTLQTEGYFKSNNIPHGRMFLP